MSYSTSSNKDTDEHADATAVDTSSLAPPMESPPTFQHDEASPIEPLVVGSEAAAVAGSSSPSLSVSSTGAASRLHTFVAVATPRRRNSSPSSTRSQPLPPPILPADPATTTTRDAATVRHAERPPPHRSSRRGGGHETTTASSSVRPHPTLDSRSSGSVNNLGGGGGGEPTVGVEADSPPLPSASWPDRLSATALTATLEVLRQLGEVTLSTTGALVAPPWHVTKTVLLPNLWIAVRESLRAASPVRWRDWFHILRRSVYHLEHTVRHTTAGHRFQHRLGLVGMDLVECLSAESTRQCLVDGMGTAVKLAEALHTPEVETLLEQLAVTACRVVEAASHGTNQRLMHDLAQAVWSACALVADPSTTTAMAEVTANLCYALEMEQQQQHYHHHSERNSTTTRTKNSRRRQERNRYQRAVADKDTIGDTAAATGVTVEQVILSSLGTNPSDNTDEPVDRNVPESIVWEHSGTPVVTNVSGSNLHQHRHQNNNPERDPAAAASSIRQQNVVKGEPTPKEDDTSITSGYERKSNKVDVEFLREAIAQRAVYVQAAQQGRKSSKGPYSATPLPPQTDSRENDAREDDDEDDDCDTDLEEIGVVTTVDDVLDGNGSDGDGVGGTTKSRRRRQRKLATLNVSTLHDEKENEAVKKDTIVGFTNQQPPNGNDEACESPSPAAEGKTPQRLQGETASQHFYRILDEIMLEKRNDAVRATLETGGYHHSNGNDFWQPKAGIVRRPNQTRTGNNSVKSRLEAIRAELGTVLSKQDLENLHRIDDNVIDQKGRRAVMVGLSVVLLFVLFWFGLGCYGLYVCFRPVVSRGAMSAPSVFKPASQEIVIRVVKEVVHVNQDGKELGSGRWNAATEATADEYQKVAKCVAAVYN